MNCQDFHWRDTYDTAVNISREFLRPGLPQSLGDRQASRTADGSSDLGAATTQHTHSAFLSIISFVLAGASLLPSHPKGVHFWTLANPFVFLHFVKKTPRASLQCWLTIFYLENGLLATKTKQADSGHSLSTESQS